MEILNPIIMFQDVIHNFWQLVLIGIGFNILGILMIVVFGVVGKIKMNDDEEESFDKFVTWRGDVIDGHMKNNGIGRLLNSLSLVFPFHTFITAVLFAFTVLFTNASSMIRAISLLDRLKLCPIKYDIKI